MRLIQLVTKKLHGSLDLNIMMFKSLNLLVGINGSGKTSALNSIEWLLNKDIKNLAINKFTELSIKFEHEKKMYRLVAKKKNNDMTINLYQGRSKKFHQIHVKLLNKARLESTGPEYYDQLAPDNNETPLWEFLGTLPTMTVINLDRRITVELEANVYESDSRRIVRKTSGTPTDLVRKVTFESYSEYRKLFIENDNNLKSEIILSALQEQSIEDSVIFDKKHRLTIDEIDGLKNTVIEYLSNTFGKGKVENKVIEFFNEFKDAVIEQKNTTNKQKYYQIIARSQYARIHNLAKLFNDFEKKNKTAFSSIRKFLECVNLFLGDSNKSMLFDESTSSIFFKTNKTEELNDISNLSSGEKQILILFAFIAFSTGSGSIFIVDEPELSLHPKWQEGFMDTFLSICPQDTQLLFATHSPEIVANHKDACIVLRGSQ